MNIVMEYNAYAYARDIQAVSSAIDVDYTRLGSSSSDQSLPREPVRRVWARVTIVVGAVAAAPSIPVIAILA